MRKRFLAFFVLLFLIIACNAMLIACSNDGSSEPGDTNETTYNRVNEEGNNDDNGNYILFGSYPQSKVTDETLTSALTALAGTLPTEDNSQAWISYGYYIECDVSNFMWYIDKEYNGEKYRGVYFTSYRPVLTDYSPNEGGSQKDNGYSLSTVYWFKYEPIKWRILTESNGKALILADLALDSQQYYYYYDDEEEMQTRNGKSVYANNYAESDIRKWLNNTFYNTAFTSLQKTLIEVTEVDNSASSTGYDSNDYACENTNDNVFLLSYKEASVYLIDSERQMKSSDYAKSQGCSQWTNSSYEGNCFWWLRSPSSYYSFDVRNIMFDGSIDEGASMNEIDFGVLPALWIRLS